MECTTMKKHIVTSKIILGLIVNTTRLIIDTGRKYKRTYQIKSCHPDSTKLVVVRCVYSAMDFPSG